MRRNGLAALTIFGLAFGLVEATVVAYLRLLLHIGTVSPTYSLVVNLGLIAFVRVHNILGSTNLTRFEMWREVATIVMLISVAWLTAPSTKGRVGAFLIAFATWDISYYLFLRLLIGWPTSLMSRDVFFLLPEPSVGPVLTAVIVSIFLLIAGLWLYLNEPLEPAKS